MNKVDIIKDMLFSLTESIGSDSFEILDHWEGDLRAIGIVHPLNHRRLVYILAVDNGFDVILEDKVKEKSEISYIDVGSYDGLSCSELIDVVKSHLNAVLA